MFLYLAKEKTGNAGLKQEDLRQDEDCLDTWFDGHIGTFGENYLVGIGFHFFQQSGGSQVLLNLLAHIETVHADIQAGSFTKRSVIIEDVDARQVILFTSM